MNPTTISNFNLSEFEPAWFPLDLEKTPVGGFGQELSSFKMALQSKNSYGN